MTSAFESGYFTLYFIWQSMCPTKIVCMCYIDVDALWDCLEVISNLFSDHYIFVILLEIFKVIKRNLHENGFPNKFSKLDIREQSHATKYLDLGKKKAG